MKCRDFKRLIHEQLDARGGVSPEVERALEGHGAECPSCRAEASRYQALRLAIAAWGPPPSPPADFADRCLERWAREVAEAEGAPRPRILRLRPVLLPLAAAASLLLGVWLGVRSGLVGPGAKPAAPSVVAMAPPVVANPPTAVTVAPTDPDSIDPEALAAALAEATSATWDFARATSAPAARVGLEILEAPEIAEATTLSFSGAPGPSSGGPRDAGERRDDRDQPFSGTARSAFGFLLGPASPPPEAPPGSTTGA